MVTKKEKYLAAAQKFLERGNFEKALAEFQNAVKEDPKDTRTWLRMAEVHVRLGHNEKATEVYQKTVDLYVEQGFFQRAVAVYKNIIKLSPDFVEARIRLADVFRQLGLLSDAVQQMEQAAALYQKTNQTEQALAAIRQIIDLNPEQPNPHIRYAELAAQSGAIKDAVAEFGEAARLLKAQGRTDEFFRVAERLLHYEPGDHAMAKGVAANYLDHNNARAALVCLKPLFEADQREPEVLELLARTFDQLGQPHKTLAVLKELARVYTEGGKDSERNQAAQRALAIDPNDAEMHELLGRSHGGPSHTPHPGTGPKFATPMPARSLSPAPGAVVQPSPVSVSPSSVASLSAAGAGRRPVAITFSEMEVPAALRNKYLTPSPDTLPASLSERISIATGLVERGDDDAEVKRILAESDVFVKYGLIERAADHLRRVFERVPTHQGAHERLAAVLVQLGRKAEAAAEYETLAHLVLSTSPADAASYARKALELNPTAKRALDVLGTVGGARPRTAASEAEASESLNLRMGTPDPELVESEEIEMISESVAVLEDAESDESSFPEDEEWATAKTGSGAAIGEEEEQQPDTSPTLDAQASLAKPVGELQSDLVQVDFFIEQGLAEEATAMLDELEAEHGAHPLLAARRKKLALLVFESTPSPSIPSQGAVPAQVHGQATERSRDGAQDHLPASTSSGKEHDVNTRVDLGIMEKTMERYQAAIAHFNFALRDPQRVVFALTMIGECRQALGDSADAIRCFQDALKRPTVTPAEATQLYYQLGSVFYELGDQSEALYYFERVSKRDANFRDVQRRLAEVKPGANVR